MKVVVIGGGASGIMSAGTASEFGAKVTIVERNEKLGKKLFITGKGRCNITNVSQTNFFDNVVSNPKFLYSAVRSFSTEDVIKFFNDIGLNTKVERGGRVFPESDKSSDVIKYLTKYLDKNSVEIKLNTYVERIEENLSNSGFIVFTNNGILECDKLIIATGGNTYSKTGSSGDGYKFARKFGHTVIKPVQSLVGIKTSEKLGLEGLTLKNVNVSIEKNGKTLKKEFGELLFTHNGISGPTVLTLSAYIARMDISDLKAVIDLKPALDYDELDARIVKDFSTQLNKEFKNALNMLLPKSLIEIIVLRSGINEYTKVNSISLNQRRRIVDAIKRFELNIEDLGEYDTGIITSGGISTKEINPSTMESKIINNLYFCGEVIDVDALTGGYNLQIAWSTGRLAGISVNK